MTAPPPPASRRRRPTVVITAGGTAGHTNPGIAVGQALVALGLEPDEVRFVGGRRGNERTLVPAAGFGIDLLAGRGIQRRLTPANISAALAVSLAAVVLRVPVIVTEQNARASAVNRFIGRFARACALPFPDTDLPKGTLTGNPTLPAVVNAVVSGDVASAREVFDLPLERVVVAVWSGSLGATRVNEVVRGLAERWADRTDVALRHVVGRRDWERFATPPEAVAAGSLVYQLVEYEDRMPTLLVAADVAVCRAGASTVAELCIAGLPAVLVPLPHAPRDHQRANTAELVAAGGAVVVSDGELTVDRLEAELGPLVADRGRRRKMARAAETVARPEAAERVARLLLEAAGVPALPPTRDAATGGQGPGGRTAGRGGRAAGGDDVGGTAGSGGRAADSGGTADAGQGGMA